MGIARERGRVVTRPTVSRGGDAGPGLSPGWAQSAEAVEAVDDVPALLELADLEESPEVDEVEPSDALLDPRLSVR